MVGLWSLPMPVHTHIVLNPYASLMHVYISVWVTLLATAVTHDYITQWWNVARIWVCIAITLPFCDLSGIGLLSSYCWEGYLQLQAVGMCLYQYSLSTHYSSLKLLMVTVPSDAGVFVYVWIVNSITTRLCRYLNHVIPQITVLEIFMLSLIFARCSYCYLTYCNPVVVSLCIVAW